MPITKPFSAIYIVKPEFINELTQELGEVSGMIGEMVFSPVKKRDVCFALDVWYNPVMTSFESISDAAKMLKPAGKFWYLHPVENVRRSRLIEEQLRKLPDLQKSFPILEELPDIGCFTLLDKNTLLYAAKRYKKWPNGKCHFIEDKENPPNRAYLKLWEAIALLGRYPGVGETAVDLGATPGGWTYVMQSLGATVTAIDKAPLDPAIASLPRVTFRQDSAFAIEPAQWEGDIDWLLCDVACYPERLYELVLKWIASNKAKQMIFTIKLQGDTDFEVLEKFKAIPNSRVINLFYNKHEATFFYPAPEHLFPSFD